MDYSVQRNRLIDQLLRYNIGELTDRRVVQALRKTPRHLFVGPSLQSNAYEDCALPIACGQTISQPYIVGLMTEWLDLKPEHRVLEIGTGCGYQTAILAELVNTVYTIEFYPILYEKGRDILNRLARIFRKKRFADMLNC